MSSFWSAFIIVLTVANIAACWWLLQKYSKRRTAEDDDVADTTGHVWDGDLTEYNKPLPLWWLMLFYLTIVFAIGYLILYPGLGTFAGTLGWTQQGQYEKQQRMADARYREAFAGLADKSLPELAADPKVLLTGQRLFVNNCTTCHGSDGRGAPGFPSLADDDWLYGGQPEQILASIMHGRNGVMPALGAGLGEQDVDAVANYVYALNGRTPPDPTLAAEGETRFRAICAACHGVDGKGMAAVGAPNLTDDIWLYGSSLDEIRHGINNGRANRMPAQQDRLGEDRVRAVAAYVLSLSRRAGSE